MDLHNEYRPSNFKEVVGQDAAVSSIAALLAEDRTPHAFLFSGPPGVGKTTLGRIIGTELGCPAAMILEVDAATYSGANDMRGLLAKSYYTMMGSNVYFCIIDECQALSKQAWQVMLKTLEEPPPHAYFVLCTTELGKVPAAVKSRCHHYDLQPVDTDDIIDVLSDVIEEERFDISDSVKVLIAREAQGNLRQALVYLSMCSTCKSKDDALRLMQSVDEESSNIVDVARALASPPKDEDDAMKRWTECIKVINSNNATAAPESIRLVVLAYFSRVLLGQKKAPGKRTLQWALHVMDCFSQTYNPSEKAAPLLMSIAAALEL